MCVPFLRLITLREKSVFFEPPHWPWVTVWLQEGVQTASITHPHPNLFSITHRDAGPQEVGRPKADRLLTLGHWSLVFRSFVNTNLSRVSFVWLCIVFYKKEKITNLSPYLTGSTVTTVTVLQLLRFSLSGPSTVDLPGDLRWKKLSTQL